ncbi:MAG: DMT family protein [Caulobacteraceae bacterium]
MIPARLLPILLLPGSNLFMTMAWYGHLKFKDRPLWLVVMASWGLAFFEYWLAVPANRWGSGVYSAAQLKAIQEVITLLVFCGFSVVYLGQKIGPNQLVGFGLIAAGSYFVFQSTGA